MGLFKKRDPVPPTKEERDGHWTRQEIFGHWRTIPDRMKIYALFQATEDQLRVMGWELPSPHDRFLAISEAKQRRDRPDLRRKIEDDADLSQEELEQWTAPLQQMHGRAVTKATADQMYREVFG